MFSSSGASVVLRGWGSVAVCNRLVNRRSAEQQTGEERIKRINGSRSDCEIRRRSPRLTQYRRI